MLASESALESDVGGSVDADGLAFGSNHFLYVSDDGGDRVLQVNPDNGDATEYVAKAAFEALGGISSTDIEAGIVGSGGGVIYVVSEGTPEAIFAIASGGTPSGTVSPARSSMSCGSSSCTTWVCAL